MKRLTRICSVFLLVAMMLSLIPVSAFAETYTKLKIRTQYTVKGHIPQRYKLTLSEDSLVKINYTGHKKDSHCYIITSPNSKMDRIDLLDITDSKGVMYLCLGKGNTFLQMYDEKGSTKVTVYVKPQSKVNQNNFNRSRAIRLYHQNWITVAQTPHYNYTRWYKLVLKQREGIELITNRGGGEYITILNSKMSIVPTITQAKRVKTEKTVPPGTYYLAVRERDYRSYTTEGYVQFLWR